MGPKNASKATPTSTDAEKATDTKDVSIKKEPGDNGEEEEIVEENPITKILLDKLQECNGKQFLKKGTVMTFQTKDIGFQSPEKVNPDANPPIEDYMNMLFYDSGGYQNVLNLYGSTRVVGFVEEFQQ